jgi:hypothetical protein
MITGDYPTGNAGRSSVIKESQGPGLTGVGVADSSAASCPAMASHPRPLAGDFGFLGEEPDE